MSVVVNIKHENKIVKKIGFKFLKKLCKTNKLYYGVPNEAYVVDKYKGKEDIRNQLFILYNQEKYGRGMSFTVLDNYDIEVVLNYPATRTDIETFYQFIKNYCKNFNCYTLIQNEEIYNVNQIEELKEEMLLFNQNILKYDMESGLTIFGCIYPIVLEDEFLIELRKLDKESAWQLYEEYLDKKQKQDFYFAKPLLYKSDEGSLIAKYVLTENVPSIFPIKPYLPFGYDQNLEENIEKWNVVFIKNNNGKLEFSEEMSFDEFYSFHDIEKSQRFDETHIIVTLDKTILLDENKKKIKHSKQELEKCLSDSNKLGCKLYKVKYINSFEDNDGIKCMVFKYKKSMFGKWLLGIVSESGVFSEMHEYNKNIEVEEAKKC